jgi:hypothetical protein
MCASADTEGENRIGLRSSTPTRGGTEQYYQRVARRLDIATQEAGPISAMLAAVAEEVASADPDPLLALRHLRLTAAQAEQLSATLQDLMANTDDAGDGQPRYGLLISLYRQPASTNQPSNRRQSHTASESTAPDAQPPG